MLILTLLPSGLLRAQEDNVKTGLNFGPLPSVAFDADKGFQYGAILQIFNYGDGSTYPNYKSRWYFESSWFTKGSKLYQVMYDNLNLFPGVRFCASARFNLDSAYDFYGMNGYGSVYDLSGDLYSQSQSLSSSSNPIFEGNAFRPFYRMRRDIYLARADFIGNITDSFYWKAGYHFTKFNTGTIDYDSINAGKDSELYPTDVPTLLDYYTRWGIIPEDEKNGGLYSCLRFGLEYDTRDKEGAPSRGIWADAHVNYAPKWLGSSVSTTRYNITWRQYFPLISQDVLTFAYRLSYTGTIGSHVPYYLLSFNSVLGPDNDAEGMGGYRTSRGILRSRVMGLDTGLYTAELRWRFAKFRLGTQNIALGLNAFSDGTMVFRPYDTSYRPTVTMGPMDQRLYNAFVKGEKDAPHITFGGGFRFIMNENFIVAVDYGTPLTHFMKNSDRYNQDGPGALYINLGYLF